MNNPLPFKVIDKVTGHLLKQKAKSRDRKSCAYFGKNRKRCAIGCLIPYKYKKEILERDLNSSVVDNVIEYLPEEYTNMFDLLRDLQYVHDRYEVEEWPEKLADLRKFYETHPTHL